MKITIESSAFRDDGMIPSKYTCDGENISPPLKWSDPPDGTRSFAVIADDPDAPAGVWVHWVIYNIPVVKRDLPEKIPADKKLPDGTIQGTSDFGRIGYGGPCPPSGTHRYFFKIYALDSLLPSTPGMTKASVLVAMKGHVIAEGSLMGKYKKK